MKEIPLEFKYILPAYHSTCMQIVSRLLFIWDEVSFKCLVAVKLTKKRWHEFKKKTEQKKIRVISVSNGFIVNLSVHCQRKRKRKRRSRRSGFVITSRNVKIVRSFESNINSSIKLEPRIHLQSGNFHIFYFGYTQSMRAAFNLKRRKKKKQSLKETRRNEKKSHFFWTAK